MAELTSYERMQRMLQRRDVDRIPAAESFWAETQKKWREEGHLPEGVGPEEHFDLDLRRGGWLNMAAKVDYTEDIVEETEQTKLVRNANGALLRWWKDKAGTPEHVDFLVKDREGWEKHIRPLLTDESAYRQRISFESYRNGLAAAKEGKRFFCWSGVNVFECMHPMCGHEYMLMGMALDPDWVRDMCSVYADLIIRLQEILFAEEGRPDGIFYYEDMGFKHKPFMSPAMYKEIVFPAHKRTFDFAHSMGLPVTVHSCGYVAPLVPGLIEAGMDCLQAMEVKAGMDLLELKRLYGDRISFMGGLDVRTMVANDRKAILTELQTKLSAAMAGGGYCLYSDHSIPNQVEYETYRYFLDTGREMGTSR